MKKEEFVRCILGKKYQNPIAKETATAFAPTNIALCKYWGKRDPELNLPVTSSLSISLANKGAKTTLSLTPDFADSFTLNGNAMDPASAFCRRLIAYLNLFRNQAKPALAIDLVSNVPIAAGLASSACGFASIALALNELFSWSLTTKELSLLARLGSGSACRSIEPGFVEWHAGHHSDGMDSFAEVLTQKWPDLCIGLHIISQKEKNISSREAMQRSIETSAYYAAWPEKVNQDLAAIKQAIQQRDFNLLGCHAESNALGMHAIMSSAWPPICYALPETIAAMHKVWELRSKGLAIYFTQDAGPNLKFIFLAKDAEEVSKHFAHLEIIKPFSEADFSNFAL